MPEDGQYCPNMLTCVDGSNEICCGWRQYVCQFVIRYNTIGRILLIIIIIKFYSHQLMYFPIQPCISLLSYIKIT